MLLTTVSVRYPTPESLLEYVVQKEEQVGALLGAGVAAGLHQRVQLGGGHGAQINLRPRGTAQQDTCQADTR